MTTWERPENLELVLSKKPEPKPQKEIKLKPALADDFSPGRKENYLYDNQGAEKPVWVKTDDYEGEAILKGKNKNGEGWIISIPERWGYEVVSADCIQVLDSQRGKYKRLPKPPEGDQIELSFDAPPQAEAPPETPKQRFKRLAKQQGIKLKSDNFAIEYLLQKYSKSAIKDLTDDELTEISDNWEKQIANVEKFQQENSFWNRLDQ